MPGFKELRTRYPVFRYESFVLQPRAGEWVAQFRFSVPPDLTFTPEVHFPAAASASVSESHLKNAIFHLGLIEALSYWKATASPVIEVRAGSLTDAQREWWRDLLIHGMREYFYRNDIDFTADDFVTIVSSGPYHENEPLHEPLPDRSLITIGGGRDSALAGALLKRAGAERRCMMLNPSPAAMQVASRVTDSPPIVVKRAICPELLELNRAGFFNGHTPFSAYLGFLGAVCLLMYGYRTIVVANERSSDEGNLIYRDREVNHQYSKSLRFEQHFDEYLQQYFAESGRYFSFVRPLYELQIARLFAEFPEFFPDFRSCNRNQKKNTWCGECPKCVSVFATMYPFVEREALVRIFGEDLYEKETTIPILRCLAGMDVKPFECVATVREMAGALSLALARFPAGSRMPPVLEFAAAHIPGVDREDTVRDILNAWGPHRMPAEFERILRDAQDSLLSAPSASTNVLKESPRSL